MAITAPYRFHGIFIGTAGGGAVWPGVFNPKFGPNITNYMADIGQGVEKLATGAQGAAPDFTFSCRALKIALDVAGINGYRVDATNLVKIYFAQYDRLGPIAGANHMMITVNRGLLAPVSMAATQQSLAQIDYSLTAEEDGATAPYTISLTESLPALVDLTEVFTLGPVSLEGAFAGGEQSIDIQFGTTVTSHGSAGSTYPHFTGITDRAALATLQTLTTSLFNTYGLAGAAISTAAKIFFRKQLRDAGIVPDATTQHILLTVNKGHIKCGDITGAEGYAGVPIVITPRYDMTNPAFQIATAVAIAA